MTDNRLAGLALIAASCGMIITMAFHPTGLIAQAQMESTIRILIAVHALGLACLPVQFLGTWRFSRHMVSSQRLAMAGLVVYAFATIAVMNAAVADGLITPRVWYQIAAATGKPAAVDGWQMVQHYNLYVNQAYAEVFVVGSSIAIFLWSISPWRTGNGARGVRIYGCILAAVTLLALFSGHLKLNAHQFGIVIFGQAAWFVIAGVSLMRNESHSPAPTP